LCYPHTFIKNHNNTVPLFLKENKYYCLLLFEYKKIELIRKAYIDYGNNLNIPSYNKYDSITKAIATDLNFKLNDSILINKCLIMVKNKSQLRKIMQLNKIIIEENGYYTNSRAGEVFIENFYLDNKKNREKIIRLLQPRLPEP